MEILIPTSIANSNEKDLFFSNYDQVKLELYAVFFGNLKSPNTRRNYYEALEDFNFYLKDYASIDDDHQAKPLNLIAYRNHLQKHGGKNKKEISEKFINLRLSALQKYYSFLIENRKIDINPVASVERLEMSEEAMSDPFPRDKVDEYFSLPFDASSSFQLVERCVTRVLFTLGRRNAEVRNLKIGSIVQMGEGYGLVFKIKGGSHIKRAMPDVLKNEIGMLLSWYEEHNWSLKQEDPLFRVTRGKSYKKHMSHQAVNNIISRMAEKVGLKGRYTSHSGRIHVISLIEEKFGLYAAKEFVSHKSVKTTEKYKAKSGEGYLKKIANLLDGKERYIG